MSLDKLCIDVGALSGKIFVGYLRPRNGMRVWTQKRDMTHEAIGAVCEHALAKGENGEGFLEVSKNGKPFATVRVQRIAPDTDMEAAGQLTLTEQE